MAAADDEKEKLDFTSEHFDAALVLTAENVQPPDPDAKPLDNLAQYSSLVSKQTTSKSSKQPAVMTIEQSMAALSAKRKQRLEAMMIKPETGDSDEHAEEKAAGTRRRRKTKNVLSFMETVQGSQGPLGILYRCLRDRTRVKVWTRNYGHVRGICTGYVAAFDKHWNLAMTDVDEVYVVRPGAKTVARGKKVVKVTDARIIVEEEEEEEQEEESITPVEEPASAESVTPVEEPASAEDEESEEALQQRLALLKEELHQISADDDETDDIVESAELPPVPTKDDIQQPLLEHERTKENRKNPRRRKKTQPVVKNRHVNQLFVRGENVVIIALLDC